MLKFLGYFLIIVGLISYVIVGIIYCLMGGIIDLCNVFIALYRHSDITVWQIAWGIIKIVFAGLFYSIAGMVFIIPGAKLINIIGD